MATPPATAGQTVAGTNPVLVVAGTLVSVVLAAFLILQVGGDYGSDGLAAGGAAANLAGASGGGGACGRGTNADPAYSVDLVATPEPPRPEGTTFLLTPRRDGRPVTGARVCMTADMPEMQHPSLDSVARDAGGGRYEARIAFGMGGTWRTWVTIAEPDRPVVSVPLTIQVAQVESGG